MSEKLDDIAKAIRNECQAHGYLVSIPENASLWVHLARAAGAEMRKPTLQMVLTAMQPENFDDMETRWNAMVDEMLK